MTTPAVCIPDTALRGLLTRPFHSQGYRVVATPAEARADQEVIATITPGPTETYTYLASRYPGSAETTMRTDTVATLHVDTGAYQADLRPLSEFATAAQFVDQIATFAACPSEFLDELDEAA